jgi:DNA-binding response OmpR family regulator
MLAALPPNSPDDLEEHRIGNVEIRPSELQVLIGSRRVGLTVREFELFVVLVERLDRVVQRAEIYGLVWGGKMPRRDRSVDVLVRKVRRKLELAAPDWTYIHTHFGIGYRFAPERQRPA